MSLDYTHSQRTAAAEKRGAALVNKTARKLDNNQDILIRADQMTLTGCTLGLMNKAAAKPYRLFISSADLKVSNVSNRAAQGPAKATLRGKFMGSGTTSATMHFRPEKRGRSLISM